MRAFFICARLACASTLGFPTGRCALLRYRNPLFGIELLRARGAARLAASLARLVGGGLFGFARGDPGHHDGSGVHVSGSLLSLWAFGHQSALSKTVET